MSTPSSASFSIFFAARVLGLDGPRPRAKVIRRGEPRRPTAFRLRVARRTTGSAAYQIARAGNPRAQARNARPILAYLYCSWRSPIPGSSAILGCFEFLDAVGRPSLGDGVKPKA